MVAGVHIDFDAAVRNSAADFRDNNFTGNVARNLGGAIFIHEWDTSENRRISLSGDFVSKNVAGVGGAIALLHVPARPSDLGTVLEPPYYRRWDYLGSETRIDGARFAENSAGCGSCSGGAIYALNEKLAIRETSFERNSAGVSGGSLFLDGDSAALVLEHCRFLGGSAAYAGTDVYSTGGGNISVANTTFSADFVPPGETRLFVIPQGGAVEFSADSTISCPLGAALNLSAATRVSYSYPWRHPALFSSTIFFCSPCGEGEYSFDHGYTENGTIHDISCNRCPAGADCTGGGANVLVLIGYWCGIENDPETFSSSAPILECSFCPEEYCTQLDRRPLNESCIETRSGPLCGRCISGHSEDLLSDVCVEDRHCRDAAWAIPLAILMGFAYAAFVAYLPVGDNPMWKSITYFMQIAQLLVSPYVIIDAFSLLSRASNFLFGLFQLQPSAAGSTAVHVCLWPGMDALRKILSEYFESAIPVACLAALLAIHWTWVRLFPGKEKEEKQEVATSHEEEPLLGQDHEGAAHKPAPASRFAKYAAAFLTLILALYEGVTETTASLLQCTTKVAGRWRLFRAGYIECPQAWQLVLGASLGSVLLLFPALLLHVRRRAHHRVNRRNAAAARAILEVLEAAYAPHARWWESVSMLRRLVFVLGVTFIADEEWRSLFLFAACLVALLYHISVKPFRDAAANRVEAAFLCDLVVLSALRIEYSVYEELGSPFAPKVRRTALAVVQVLLVLLPLMYAVLVAAIAAWPRALQLCGKARTLLRCS